ncbi:MAG: sensor histidine kinase, partial [Lachnoanaerobaculum saburreum]
MNKLLSFLKSEYRVFITLLFVCFIFGGVFLFAGLNMEYFILGLEITVFSLLIFLIMEWLSYVKKEDMAKRIEELEIENKILQSKI